LGPSLTGSLQLRQRLNLEARLEKVDGRLLASLSVVQRKHGTRDNACALFCQHLSIRYLKLPKICALQSIFPVIPDNAMTFLFFRGIKSQGFIKFNLMKLW
jgi:hypothetical protein